ncbi:MAG: M14 family zinc carboxypeptidase, partial [candidate division Zixibacteria bacterium]
MSNLHKKTNYLSVGLSLLLLFAVSASGSTHPSFSPNKLAEIDTLPFYSGGNYDRAIPEPREIFGHPIGEWPVRYNDLVDYINLLAETSDRVRLETHGTTHEGRDLFNIFISTTDNLSKLDDYREDMSRLADPTINLTAAERKSLLDDLPAFAWLGYSIHGDEISGVDAGMQLLYHLAAAGDSVTLHLLENVIIIIDPTENPDGRERYLSMLQTYRSYTPNYDRHSLQHGGVWPAGRGNHYLFDLNRDWILVNQPETKGKLRTILKYNPVMTVDAHEMGANATYLFTPPREPINANTPQNVRKWWDVFSKEQTGAFDSRRWPYYVGEWHEQWYPGYGSAWSTFFGSIGILYEQAGVDGAFVKQGDDYVLSYHESVNHQFTSSLTNLYTVANNRRELLSDYRDTRLAILKQGQNSGLKYLVEPGRDKLKMNRFIQSLLDQNIKVSRATASFTVSKATNIYGKDYRSKSFAAGTFIVSTAQAHGALANTIFEFDPHFSPEFLKEERRELEKHGDTRVYEVTAWSTPVAYNLDAYSSNSSVSVAAESVTEVTDGTGELSQPEAKYAFVIDMEGEQTYRALNLLFQNEITVYGSQKPFTLENREYRSGALVIRRRGNRGDLVQVLSEIATEIGVNIYGVNSGGSSKGSYLGAPTFEVLRQPRVALLTGSPFSSTSFATLWFSLDKQIEIPHSLLYLENLRWTDLSKYNVLIVPSSWGSGLGERFGKSGTGKIKSWVKNGGTLICMGQSSVWAADSSTGLSQVRLKRQSLDKLEKYATAVSRERQAEQPEIDTMAIWHPEKVQAADEETDDKKETTSPPKKEKAEETDKWQRKFFPRGVIMNAAIDTEFWLSIGLGKNVPVMMYTSYAFLASPPVKTVARFESANDLRIAGLLWPEARVRWAET